jgi:hypothetical protein
MLMNKASVAREIRLGGAEEVNKLGKIKFLLKKLRI